MEGVPGFIKRHRGHKVASTAMAESITRCSVDAMTRSTPEEFERELRYPGEGEVYAALKLEKLGIKGRTSVSGL